MRQAFILLILEIIVGRKYRDICCVDGCNNYTSSKGRINGKTYYSKYCSKHRAANKLDRKCNKRNECVLCGWKGPCDLHRIKFGRDGGRYIKGNIIVICPNCHRLIHKLSLCIIRKQNIIDEKTLFSLC